MKKRIIFLLLFMVSLSSFCSSKIVDNDSIVRYYKIELDDRPQSIEFFELKNKKYVGFINTSLDKGMYPSGWVGRAWWGLWNKKNTRYFRQRKNTCFFSKRYNVGVKKVQY